MSYNIQESRQQKNKKTNMLDYQKQLKIKMNDLAHKVYQTTKILPHHERYGLTSQINRASLSVILNYIEGYARVKKGYRINFLEMSYGSLKETQYLLHFIYIEKFINKENFDRLFSLADEIGAMLWTEIKNIKD